MKQQALLAKTLVHDPSVLLLDEPAANLDPKARIDLRNLLRRLASSGKTILVSSHILSELEDLCDSIGIMNRGSMELSGSIEEVSASASPTLELFNSKVVNHFPMLSEIFSQFPEITQHAQLDDSARHFELTHTGDSENAAALLSKLIESGAQVSNFHLKQSKMEDLFLEVEAGKIKKGKNP